VGPATLRDWHAKPRRERRDYSREIADGGDRRIRLLRLEIRPRHVAPISNLNPANKDTRAQGRALYAIRQESGA
jgi:hypothetical protein